MTLPVMYPGIVNSPPAELTAGIDADDTTIPVSELAYFPDPGTTGNEATIGDDDELSPETILYTGKSAASGAGNLTGVTRAFQGTAQSWDSGTLIARKYTEYDYDALIENITNHEHPLPKGGVLSWSEVTGTTQACAVNVGYILNNAALVTATLPTTAAVGDVIRIVGKGAGMWKVAQNASQYIRFAGLTTTTGTSGYLQAENAYDCIEIMCTTANVGWIVVSSMGNIMVV